MRSPTVYLMLTLGVVLPAALSGCGDDDGHVALDAGDAALADAGVPWKQIQAVCAASSRFSGGKGWGLNGNDVVEELGTTGIPVYNMSAGCAAAGDRKSVG